jgi:ribosomal protein S18 acetylase RimI-like enzyme
MQQVIRIEKADAAQRDNILDLAKRTFVETYGEYNDPNNLSIYLEESFSSEVINAELNDPHARFFMAWLDERPVGFVKIRDDRTARGLEGVRTLEIQRIYVLAEFQGSNVGTALMDMVKELGREEQYQTLWLQVWQKNERAIRFYQRSGFVVYETALFKLGNELQNDFLMRYDLYL